MIGVFDSGVGGLNMLRQLQLQLPQHDTLYLGDQLNAPFGNRSAASVTAITQRGVAWLFSQGCELVLIACNTASADALRAVQSHYGGDKVVLGCIIPAVEAALQVTRRGQLGLLATRGTVECGDYATEINKLAETHYFPVDHRALAAPRLTAIAAPLLVPLVEEDWHTRPEARSIAKKYLLPFKHANVDTIILGCTHYGLMHKTIAAKLPAHCAIVDSATAQAAATVTYLQRHTALAAQLKQSSTRRYATTDCPERFYQLGNQLLGDKMGQSGVERVNL